MIRSGKLLVLTGAAAIAERYPDLASRPGTALVVCLPLRVRARTIGVIGLSFPGQRTSTRPSSTSSTSWPTPAPRRCERIQAEQEAADADRQADVPRRGLRRAGQQPRLRGHPGPGGPAGGADLRRLVRDRPGRGRPAAPARGGARRPGARSSCALELAERYPRDPDAPGGAVAGDRAPGAASSSPRSPTRCSSPAPGTRSTCASPASCSLRSALMVPLVARGRALGVITWVARRVGTPLHARTTSRFAEDLARRGGVADRQLRAAQPDPGRGRRSCSAPCCPTRCRRSPGWEVAAYYSPSGRTEVGGDFYDAIALGDGRLAVFVGDVMGRGVRGRGVDGADAGGRPRLHRASTPTPGVVLQQARPDVRRSTAATSSSRSSTSWSTRRRDELLVANAGHRPPVVLRARRVASSSCPLADGAPLGRPAGEPRQQHRSGSGPATPCWPSPMA